AGQHRAVGGGMRTRRCHPECTTRHRPPSTRAGMRRGTAMTPRFGLELDLGSFEVPVAQRIDEYVPIIEAAEEAGLDSVWLGEGYPTSAQDPVGFHLPSPLLAVSALAGRTGLRLGTGVNLLQAWHPLRLAYDAAVAEQITGGRLTIGAALGPAELTRRFDGPAGPRGAVCEDKVEFMRAMWRGEQRYRGRFHSADEGIWPLPLQRGGMPLVIGGGVDASARRAARIGDGYYASTGYPLDKIEHLAGVYRAELPAAVEPAVLVNRMTVVDNVEQRLESLIQRHVTPLVQAYANFGAVSPGTTADRSGDLALLGTPEQVATQVLRYLRAGVTELQFRVRPHGLPVDDAVRTVRLIGSEVLPRVRAAQG